MLLSAHRLCLCFVFIWEQTAIFSLYNFIWLVFIAMMKSVYYAIQTESLNKAVYLSSLTFILLIWRIGRAPNRIPIYSYIQLDATSHSLFISGNCSTCFGWYFHPSSGEHTTVSQHLVFVTPLLLSAAIVEELEPVWVCCGWRTPPTACSNLFQLFHDSVR
jgi:hypothetical protein